MSILRNILFFVVFAGGGAFVVFLDGEIPLGDPVRIESGLYNRFWQLKIRGTEQGNVLLLGNSRVNEGLSPDILTAELPGENWKGLNLAFNGGGLNSTIFEFADRRLDGDAARKIIVLGISPGQLTQEGVKNEHFHGLLKRSPFLAAAYIRFPVITGLLMREEPDPQVLHYHGQHEFHDDGWEAAMRLPNEYPEAWLPGFRRLFSIYKVDPELQKAVMHQTQAWTESGIRVFAFRPPVSPAMLEIENTLGAFDGGAFAAVLEAHGGHWIDIDASQYRTYDNSHLPRSEAIRLSREIGRKIAAALADSM